MASFGQNLGQLIKRYRLSRGELQETVALKAFGDGASRTRISEIERGLRDDIRAKTYAPLVGYLNIPQEEVDACRSAAQPEVSAAPDAPVDDAPDLPRELLENLAQRFGVENPDAPAFELTRFLKDKAKEWKALKARIEGLEAVDKRLANQRVAAEDAVARGNFKEADDILAGAEEIQIKEKALGEAVKAAEIRETRADIALMDGRVEDAVELYRTAIAFVEPFDLATAIDRRNANAVDLAEHGERFASVGTKHAADIWRESLNQINRDSMPVDWARTQMNRANALGSLGERTGGEQGIALLQQAITAFDAALVIYTRDTVTENWALTQMNRANALQTLGERMGSEQGIALLQQAVTAYDAALEILTRDSVRVDWAMTQMNRANALLRLGEWTGGEQGVALLQQAITAYDAVLENLTRDSMPAGWARTQMNRAIALQTLGERMGGEQGIALLQQAVTAYDAALEVLDSPETAHYAAIARKNRTLALTALKKLED